MNNPGPPPGEAKPPQQFVQTPTKSAAGRLEICKTCPHRTTSIVGDRCLKCGCIIKLKVKIPMSHCPIGKW